MIKPSQHRVMSASRRGSVAIPRSNRRERHRLETHDKLYRSALELFGERGFLETTVEDITEAADVGKGTFFNYFRTKEHVLAAYGGERIAAVERALEKARSGSAPVLDVLGELAEDSAGQSHVNPAVLRAIYAAHRLARRCAPNFRNGCRPAANCLPTLFRWHRNAAKCGETCWQSNSRG